MTKENLRYVTFTQKQNEVALAVYLTAGGAAIHFIEGEPAERTIGKLRYLAAMLEHGAQIRGKPEIQQSPNAFNALGEALRNAR